jgi:membrane protease YdiL (CAAX protease family)
MKNIHEEKKNRNDLKKETLVFLGILTSLTFIHFLWFYLNYGTWTNVPVYTTLVHMLIPATSAMICMVYFRDRALNRESKLFLGIFAVYVIVFLIESFYHPLIHYPLINLPVIKAVPLLSSLIAVFGFITIIIMNIKKKWRKNLAKSKLWFGKNKKFFIGFSVLFALIIISLNYLNHLFGFGNPLLAYDLGNFFTTYIILSILSLFIVWPQYFGEEYGWRVYLQDRLFPLFGPYIGVVLIGVIWGVWHAGNIVMGMNWPGQPILGILNITILTIILAVIYGYAVLVTRSVWIAVALHLIIDTTEVASILYLSQTESLLSFGGGLYSTVLLGIFALLVLILGRNVWKKVVVVKN